jgi:hypothetical protein
MCRGNVLSFVLIQMKEPKCRLAASRISFSNINEREKNQDCGKMTGNFIVALKQMKYVGDKQWRRRPIFVYKRATRSFLTSFPQCREEKLKNCEEGFFAPLL